MLKAHFDKVEKMLLAQSGVASNAGHSVNKGTPRENFIHEFLEAHLASTVAIGHGEVIDASSSPREQRNQIDIVIYKRNYPKLRFGGEIHGFLAESVIATIEVKSVLDRAGLKQAVQAARNLKALQRSVRGVIMMAGYLPPSILSYVVAYDGPASMHTVHGWLGPIHNEFGMTLPTLPTSQAERMRVASPTVDGIFVLGKGYVGFDNSPLDPMQEWVRETGLQHHWQVADMHDGNLLLLFLLLTISVGGVEAVSVDPTPYVKNFDRCHFSLVP